MIRHRPADDLAAVQVHDGGQIEPALNSLDISDVGEPDLVQRGGAEVPLEQVRGDREVVTAVGGAHPPWPRHDGPDPVTAHQSLDATAARPAALGPQLGMDARAAIASARLAVDPFDVVDERTIGYGSPALRARAPGIITGRRDSEYLAQDRHRVVSAAIFDEAESHVRVPAKIAIDFFKNSRIDGARNGLQHEAQRFGAPLEVGEDAVAILLLIVIGARIPVAHAMPKCVVEQDRNLPKKQPDRWRPERPATRSP